MLSANVALSGEMKTLLAFGSASRRSVKAMPKPVDASVRFIDTGRTGGKDSGWPHAATKIAPKKAAAMPRRPLMTLITLNCPLR